MNKDLISYYKQRAKEYENIYLKPERQPDLQSATTILQDIYTNKNIAEICCGTGYWTEKMAKTASSIFATDINESVIEIAKHKDYANSNVTFEIADFFSYEPVKKYDGLFGGFIWSHIPLQDLKKFIDKANQFVSPDGVVVFMDNNYVAGSNHPITETDVQGNTFQTRKLENGTTYLVRKNFPSETFILEQLKGLGKDIKIITLKYYWILIYKSLPG